MFLYRKISTNFWAISKPNKLFYDIFPDKYLYLEQRQLYQMKVFIVFCNNVGGIQINDLVNIMTLILSYYYISCIFEYIICQF